MIKQPISFYDSIQQQNRFKLNGDMPVYELTCPKQKLLPFQIRRDTTPLSISVFKLINLDTQVEYDILSSLAVGSLKTYNFNTVDSIVYFGIEDYSLSVPEGSYYIEISDSIFTKYSEVINLIDFNGDIFGSNCILSKIVYWDLCDIDNIFYRTVESGDPQYKNIIYSKTPLGKPTYSFSKEGSKNGLGVFTPEILTTSKNIKLEQVIHQQMIDSLSTLPLHSREGSHIELYNTFGLIAEVEVEMSNPKWTDNSGTWAVVELDFIIHTVVLTQCCKDSLDLISECLPGVPKVVATIVENSDDYNNFKYTDAKDNTTKINLVDGDHVMIDSIVGEWHLKQYDVLSASYINIPFYAPSNGATQGDQNEIEGINLGSLKYYFKTTTAEWSSKPTINTLNDLGGGQYEIQGLTYREGSVEIVNVGPFGHKVVASGLGSDYVDTNIVFTKEPNASGVYVRALGYSCQLRESSTALFGLQIEGIGIDIVGTDIIN